jgi:AmmeMemoRadiSam system protein B
MESAGVDVRSPQYAGSFYPSNPKELASMLAQMLEENNFQRTAKKLKIDCKKIRAAVVPHAGYIYSGPTAAVAYNAIAEAKPKRVVLLGPSHQSYIDGAYSFSGAWSTPLGITHLNNSRLEMHSISNDFEHSLEVQLPFLQSVLDGFELTPIIYGEVDAEDLAKEIAPLEAKGTLFLASSDLSHYLPYEEAKAVDAETIEAVLSLDLEKFLRVGDACGKTGIAALMVLAKKKKWKPHLLDYRNSGDTAGDKDKVVGYAAIVFVEK